MLKTIETYHDVDIKYNDEDGIYSVPTRHPAETYSFLTPATSLSSAKEFIKSFNVSNGCVVLD